MGFVVFAAIGLYLLISIGVMALAISHAKKNGKSAMRWGGGAALVMYLLVFWDHIPTILVQKYYCKKEAGFWVYKTIDQWKAENPVVAETLVTIKDAASKRDGDMQQYIDTYFLNQRLNWVVSRKGRFFPNQWRHEQTIVDTENGNVLARYVDYSTSQESPQAGWSGWKFWLENRHCTDGALNRDRMEHLMLLFKGSKS
jgi:hypothetical protein